MAEKFDPYYRWLGIPAKEQPPNHYRLLGIELFESDPQLIDSFALRHTSFLREITDGPHLPDAQRLLNELAAARRCLLDPQRKAAYDAELRERLAAADTPLSPADDVVPPPPPERRPSRRLGSNCAERRSPDCSCHAERVDSSAAGAGSRRMKTGRPPTWLLAGWVAVTLVAIGFTGLSWCDRCSLARHPPRDCPHKDLGSRPWRTRRRPSPSRWRSEAGTADQTGAKDSPAAASDRPTGRRIGSIRRK